VLYRTSERSIPKVAQELGIADESLRRWIRQHEIDSGEREGLSTEAREELGRLRRENGVLKQEKETMYVLGSSHLHSTCQWVRAWGYQLRCDADAAAEWVLRRDACQPFLTREPDVSPARS
jgi:transposase-like protein